MFFFIAVDGEWFVVGVRWFTGQHQESLFHGVYAAVQGINRLAEPHTTCHSETEFEFVREIPESGEKYFTIGLF